MQEDTKTTEQQILEAAEREFLTKGFAGARTTSIAEAAGVTHAMFHYYFRTKEKLFGKIVADKVNALRKIFFGAFIEGTTSLTERIRNGVARHFDFVAANPQLPMFMFNEIYRNPERSASFTDVVKYVAGEVIGSLQRQIDEAAETGECRPMNAAQFLLDIVSLNLFTFMAEPMLNATGLFGDKASFLEKRKQENIETIMLRMKP